MSQNNNGTFKKIKVLSLTNKILEYRIPVYNRLSEYFDVTVAHHGELVNKSKAQFKQISLTLEIRAVYLF